MTDKIKARAAQLRYRLKNPEKYKAAIAAWRAKDPERQREYTRKWRRENLEKSRLLNRLNRRKRIEKVRVYEAKRLAERAELIASIKLAQGCALCGYREHAVALDFDHLDPSDKRMAVGPAKTGNLQKLLAEISRCRVLCANCHRVQTAGDPRVRQKRLDSTRAKRREIPVEALPLFESEVLN
jgi:chromatin segregation and condensation protein Rec8/ScpA/Scc1 (kleisin family)